ncbi:hypothetical protein K438DRAFT_1985758 [Mycena galopus ATCC 62051]|nr:hypothetical protein K438DRAFT_1985758 [Mycena galopus ATCC 62051]
MEDNALETVFDGLRIAPEPSFHPRQGFEYLRGSETGWFYVVIEGHVPGIYTHWEDVAPQVAGFSNSVYKKHLGWSAATAACDATRRSRTIIPVPSPIPVAGPSTPPLQRDTGSQGHHARHLRSPRRQAHGASTSAPSTPRDSSTGSRKPPVLYVYSRGDDTTIYTDQQQAFSAARRGLADSSFRKVDTTTRLSNAFDLATESALEVINISSDSE